MFKVFVHDGESQMPSDDIMYIIGKEGIFLKKTVGLIHSVAPVDKISILQSVETFAQMQIPPMPGQNFAQIMSFFRAVYNEHRSEAMSLLYYNVKKQQHWIRIPVQEVSYGGVDYENFEDHERGFDLIGTIHSHGSMGAFHSGTDDADEKYFDGLHITIGDNDEEYQSISASIVVNGKRVKVNPMDYVEDLNAEEYTHVPLWVQRQFTNARNENRSKYWDDYYAKQITKKLGWVVNIPEVDKDFPSIWMDFVSKKAYSNVYSSGVQYIQPQLFGYGYGDIWDTSGDFNAKSRSGGQVVPSRSIGFVGEGDGATDDGDDEPPCEQCKYFEEMVEKVLTEYDFTDVEDEAKSAEDLVAAQHDDPAFLR